MPEEKYHDLNISNGVWIDIFVYFNRPRNSKLAELQDLLMYWVQSCCEKYYTRSKHIEYNYQMSFSQKIIDFLPSLLVSIIRNILFSIAINMGKDGSNLVWSDFFFSKKQSVTRDAFESNGKITEFENREFPIPSNYDLQLKINYGDYMTPYKTESHADLSKIKL